MLLVYGIVKMIEKKFIRNGNSWCISIPTSVLKILEIDPEEDKIQLTLQNNDILIKKIKNDKK
jgi:antitoxin component of MazEF toxin-antitoxin module